MAAVTICSDFGAPQNKSLTLFPLFHIYFPWSDGTRCHDLCFLQMSYVQLMAPHSSTFAWKIPWTEEPGGLQSMGSLGVGHYWATSLSLFTFMRWRRKWQSTPVLLPGKSHGQRSLVGYSPWGRKESDTTERLHFHFKFHCVVISLTKIVTIIKTGNLNNPFLVG